MSPALIRQLLYICAFPDPEVNESCADFLLKENLIRHGSHGLQVTERGRKMMELLQEVPLPVQVWTDPRGVK